MRSPYLLTHYVEDASVKYPDRIAFKCGKDQVTYLELWERSNQLANALIDNGVRKGDRVGIYMFRSLETAISIYGIMQAGAVFVPIDTNSPIPRVRTVLQDCGIVHLISNQLLNKQLQKLDLGTAEIKCVYGIELVGEGANCKDWYEILKYPKQIEFPVNLLEDDLAYIYFTSGSTGNPKGIMHTHFSGMSIAKLSTELYDLGTEDIFALYPPLHFDQSAFGYFGVPLIGCSGIIIPEMHTKLPISLSQLIEKEKISIWYSVPLALIQILQKGAIEKRDFSRLKWVLYGGEPFPPKLLAQMMSILPWTTFSNVYGPTEVNQCTYHHLKDVPDISQSIPIGKIWGNTEIKIVDDLGIEVLPGEIGELLVRSSTMMKGYWNNEALTKASFCTEESWTGVFKTYYKTGDLMKMDSDGKLYFFGRKDRQVKIRGFRVEIEEIEVAINSHENIKECAVVPIDNNGQGEKELVALVMVHDLSKYDPTSLKLFLQEKIQKYSIPSKLIAVSGLPRTNNGKVDYRTLVKDYSYENNIVEQ